MAIDLGLLPEAVQGPRHLALSCLSLKARGLYLTKVSSLFPGLGLSGEQGMVALKKTTQIQVQPNNHPMESPAQVCNWFGSPGLDEVIGTLMALRGD